MNSILGKCQISTGWVLLACMVISGFTADVKAELSLCGFNKPPPARVSLKTGEHLLVVGSGITALKGIKEIDEKELQRVLHRLVVDLVKPGSGKVWSRTLTVASLFIAETNETFGTIRYNRRHSFFGSPQLTPVGSLRAEMCTTAGLVAHANRDFIVVASGFSSVDLLSVENEGADDEKIRLKDEAIMNVWILNATNGKIVRTFQARPRPGWVLQPKSSYIGDIDGDGNDELVWYYLRFPEADTYVVGLESYNIFTGDLEDRTNTWQERAKLESKHRTIFE